MDFNNEDFFYCERCSCTMLKSVCIDRLNKLMNVKEKFPNYLYSIDIHCVKCDQGKEISGLYANTSRNICNYPGCKKDVYANGVCRAHEYHVRKFVDISDKVGIKNYLMNLNLEYDLTNGQAVHFKGVSYEL